jgi:REP element-mobilizing transposase RayT
LEDLGLPLHVIAQGIESCWIFLDDWDRERFLRRALRVFREMGVEVFAWALMSNHVHLALQSTLDRIGKSMQRVLGPYAQEFNRRHGRVGRLFRDRFWSRPVDDGEDDLVGLIGYVILNPLRGGLVDSLAELSDYPWTSLAELISPPANRKRLVHRETALALFGPDTATALDGLQDMLALRYGADPEGRTRSYDEPGGGLSRRDRTDLQADSLLALRMRSARIEEVLRAREGTTALRMLLVQRGWSLSRTIVRAVAVVNAVETLVRNGGRRRPESHARSLVAYFAWAHLRCPDVDIARATGVSRQAICRARERGARIAAKRGLTPTTFFGL